MVTSIVQKEHPLSINDDDDDVVLVGTVINLLDDDDDEDDEQELDNCTKVDDNNDDGDDGNEDEEAEDDGGFDNIEWNNKSEALRIGIDERKPSSPSQTEQTNQISNFNFHPATVATTNIVSTNILLPNKKKPSVKPSVVKAACGITVRKSTSNNTSQYNNITNNKEKKLLEIQSKQIKEMQKRLDEKDRQLVQIKREKDTILERTRMLAATELLNHMRTVLLERKIFGSADTKISTMFCQLVQKLKNERNNIAHPNPLMTFDDYNAPIPLLNDLIIPKMQNIFFSNGGDIHVWNTIQQGLFNEIVLEETTRRLSGCKNNNNNNINNNNNKRKNNNVANNNNTKKQKRSNNNNNNINSNGPATMGLNNNIRHPPPPPPPPLRVPPPPPPPPPPRPHNIPPPPRRPHMLPLPFNNNNCFPSTMQNNNSFAYYQP